MKPKQPISEPLRWNRIILTITMGWLRSTCNRGSPKKHCIMQKPWVGYCLIIPESDNYWTIFNNSFNLP